MRPVADEGQAQVAGSGCSSVGSASTSRSTPAACSSGPTNSISRSSGPTPISILTWPKSSGHSHSLGSRPSIGKAWTQPAVQAQLADGPVAQPVGRQDAVDAVGQLALGCSISSDSVARRGRRCGASPRSSSATGPSGGCRATAPGRSSTRAGGSGRTAAARAAAARRRGRTAGPAPAASRPARTSQRVVVDAVDLAVGSLQLRAGGDEDVDLVALGGLPGGQLGDEAGRPGRRWPDGQRGEGEGGDAQRLPQLRLAPLAAGCAPAPRRCRPPRRGRRPSSTSRAGVVVPRARRRRGERHDVRAGRRDELAVAQQEADLGQLPGAGPGQVEEELAAQRRQRVVLDAVGVEAVEVDVGDVVEPQDQPAVVPGVAAAPGGLVDPVRAGCASGRSPATGSTMARPTWLCGGAIALGRPAARRSPRRRGAGPRGPGGGVARRPCRRRGGSAAGPRLRGRAVAVPGRGRRSSMSWPIVVLEQVRGNHAVAPWRAGEPALPRVVRTTSSVRSRPAVADARRLQAQATLA